MPIHPVYRKGRVYGYQWGEKGKIYPLAQYGLVRAMKKAQEQGRAAYAAGYKGSKTTTTVKKHKRKGRTVKKHRRRVKK